MKILIGVGKEMSEFLKLEKFAKPSQLQLTCMKCVPCVKTDMDFLSFRRLI
jgi:hypothetical protein